MACCEKPGIFGKGPSTLKVEAGRLFIARNEIERICDQIAEAGKIKRDQLLDLFALERISTARDEFGRFELPAGLIPSIKISEVSIIVNVGKERFEFSRREISEREQELAKKLGKRIGAYS